MSVVCALPRHWLRVSLWVVSLLVCVTRMGAQVPASSGTLQGTVIGMPQNVALPFAVIGIPQLSIERFTDGEGRFTLTQLQPGRYDVVVRRIGYSPFRGTVSIEIGAIARLDVQLTQIPAQLATTIVHAMTSCPRPGAPDRVREPVVATLVALLRENADRYRLLVSAYPFSYRQLRAMGELADGTLSVQQVDTILVKGEARATYRPGRIVNRVSNSRGVPEYAMTLPTILDLADENFVRNHCFAYGGTSQQDAETWFRLDVRAADKLRTPDVHGSFYLDSASFELRRMDLTMSRPDRLPQFLRGVAGVEAVTSFRRIADGLSVIDKVCGLNFWRRSGLRVANVSAVELQQLLSYAFTSAPVGVVPRQDLAPASSWRPGASLERGTVWCAN